MSLCTPTRIIRFAKSTQMACEGSMTPTHRFGDDVKFAAGGLSGNGGGVGGEVGLAGVPGMGRAFGKGTMPAFTHVEILCGEPTTISA